MRKPEDKQAPEPLNQEKEAPMRRGPDPVPFHPGMGGGLSGETVESGNDRGGPGKPETVEPEESGPD